MKIKFSVLILLLMLCLSACAPSKTLPDSKQDPSPSPSPSNSTVPPTFIQVIKISATIEKEEIKKDESFEIRVGIGRMPGVNAYPSGTLIIQAPKCAILLSDGSTSEEQFVYEYTDFMDEKYHHDSNGDIKFFETYRFTYVGEEEEYMGHIRFTLSLPSGSGNTVYAHAYFKVNGETIEITKENPLGMS